MKNLLTYAIPQELQQLNSWVCWKYQDREGIQTKVPCNPETGIPVNPLNTLYSFEEACQYAERFSDIVNGIGFYFTGNGISGIDLDKCIDEDGILSAAAREIIEKLDSYTEYSPSGKGIHIIFKGTLPCGSRNRKDNYEVYSDKRYFTVTGNVFENRTTLAARQEELEWFVEKYTQPKKLSQADEIIQIIKSSKSSDKFNKLMNGEISNYGNDDSAADAALMAILAFFTKKNPALMEEIFNQSKLSQRDKWTKRKDYRDRTISNAIGITKDVYAGTYPFESTDKFPSQDEQRLAADNILEQYGNPCKRFDTSVLPPLIRRYVDHICNLMDADPIIVTSAAIGMISGILQKSLYIPEPDGVRASHQCYFDRLYPNVYILNVLQSGRFKTTALNAGLRIAYKIEEYAKSLEGDPSTLFKSLPYHKNIFLPNKTTPEALLRDLQELGGGLISLSEFGSWLQEMNKNYNIGLKSLFTDFYDVPKRRGVSTMRDGQQYFERPCISIVGVSTINWVKDSINKTDVDSGFFARFLLFNPPANNTIPRAMPVKKHVADDTIESELFELFTQKVPSIPREYSLTMEAYNRFTEIHNLMYEHLSQLPDRQKTILDPFLKRWSPYVLKLGMIFQFMLDPDSDEISIEPINSAFQVVRYAMQSTVYLLNNELLESPHQSNCRKVVEYIAGRTSKNLKTTWSNIISSRILDKGAKEYEVVVKDLIESNKVEVANPHAKKGNQIYYLITGGGNLECLE